MLGYVLKKAVRLLIVLFGVSVLTFSFTSFIQGNPAEVALSQTGIEPTKQEIKIMEEQMGIDENIYVQYLNWIKKVVRLDFGNSYITGTPVMEEIIIRMPATIKLTVASFIVMIILSISIGILAAVFRKSFLSIFIDSISFCFMGIPGFVLGLIIAYIFSVKLNIFPMVGNKTVLCYVLPVLTLSIPMSCRYIRIIKTNIIEVLSEDYIFMLKTKGIRDKVIILNNALKNAFIPVVNLMGISLGSLFGGSVVVENIFSWPGLGSYIMTSINNRDYPVILAYVIIMAVVFVGINYIVDIIVCLLDPRIRLQEGKINEQN